VAKGTHVRQTTLNVLTGIVVAVVVVSCLYWAQSIFIPLALAIYLSFLLGPLVSWLEHKGVHRIVAVLGAMLLTVLLFVGMIWLVTSQVTGLLERLPRYNTNIQAKVKVVTDRMHTLSEHINAILGPAATPPADDEAPRQEPVILRTDSTEWATRLLGMLLPVAHGLAGGVLALVLTGFMLLKREEMRNRVIRLASGGRFIVTTKAIDEASHRVSRFLVMQALISAIAGVSIGLGLLAIGIEYALLWGFLIFLLRYIPYVGIWFAAVPPVLLGFAMFEGWGRPIMAIGVIFTVEMICGNMLEPWLFGRSMGVSEVALLVSAAFWAFLWGPIGMVLSSPMTVCLVVLGKYNPKLKFLDILLGDEPALERSHRFYQRLLARDEDEAEEIALGHLQEAPAETVFDTVLVPTLVFARRDRERDDLSEDDEEFVLRATREIGEDLAERLVPREADSTDDGEHPPRKHLLACPAHDVEDEAVLRLLAATLSPDRWEVELRSPTDLVSLLVSSVEKEPDQICIAALPPGGMAHTRYLCKRLRLRFPGVKILVLRCGTESQDKTAFEPLLRAGADVVASTLGEARARLYDEYRAVEGTQESELQAAHR
jgi:predicted PurR-regulated permease PerM